MTTKKIYVGKAHYPYGELALDILEHLAPIFILAALLLITCAPELFFE